MPTRGGIRGSGAIVGDRDWTVASAEGVTRCLLPGLSNRLGQFSGGCPAGARLVVSTVPVADHQLLLMAAVVHDIGMGSRWSRLVFSGRLVPTTKSGWVRRTGWLRW
jgi:hypothetical protein